VFWTSCWNVYWYVAGLLDLPNPIWSGAMTRYPRETRNRMLGSQYDAVKFFPWRSRTTWPFGFSAATSMYAISSVRRCVWSSWTRTGNGYVYALNTSSKRASSPGAAAPHARKRQRASAIDIRIRIYRMRGETVRLLHRLAKSSSRKKRGPVVLTPPARGREVDPPTSQVPRDSQTLGTTW
jgi:hypothetical protein